MANEKKLTVEQEIEQTVARLKKQHSVVHVMKIPKNDEQTEFAIAYLRKPTRMEVKPVIKMASSQPIDAMEILLNTCWLEGDQEIKDEDELFYSALNIVEKLIKFRVGELKKN